MTRQRSLAILAAVLLGVSLSGCGQRAGTVDDLTHALSAAHSAIESSSLALDLYHHQRLTRAAVQTTLRDTSQEITDAQHGLSEVTIGAARDRRDRDDTMRALDAGVAAVLESRDDLELRADPLSGRPALDAAERQIDAVRDRLAKAS